MPLRAPGRFRSAATRRSCLGAALTVVLLGCADTSPRQSPEGVRAELIVDLLRYLPEAEADDKRPLLEMVTKDGDTRPSVGMRVPRRVELGPLETSGDCALEFAFGASRRPNKRGGAVAVQAWVKRGEVETEVFTEEIDPVSETARYWQSREVEIPQSEGPFSIVFGSAVRGRRAPTRVQLASPHLRCRQRLLEPRKSKPDVVLISLDTLRRDRLGFYGYDETVSPTLNELAAESVVFDNAFSVANYTLPTHASMFTGLSPTRHGAGHASMHAPLNPEVGTLAEILAAAGYATVGFSAGGTVSREMGIDRGFSEWNERRRANLASNLPAVFDAVGRHQRQPLFLFLHTYDIHAPYEQWETQNRGGEDEDKVAMEGLQRETYHRHHQLERFNSASQLDAAYVGGIRTVDAQLKRFFDYLKEAGVYDQALIIVTSDHGESLFEGERYYGHGHSLGDQEIRVPLLVRLPAARRTGRESGFVQPMDLVPMILAETGVDWEGEVEGRNPLGPSQDSAPTYVVGESSIMGSKYIRSERWKVISPTADYWQQRRGRIFEGSGDRFPLSWQVYDLSTDALEEHNLFGELETFPSEVRQLTRVLRELESPGSVEATAAPPTGEMADHLRALGYLR